MLQRSLSIVATSFYAKRIIYIYRYIALNVSPLPLLKM